MEEKINRAKARLLRLAVQLANRSQDERGEVSIEYVLIAAGLLVVVYGAYSFLGGAVSGYVRGLPALLGF